MSKICKEIADFIKDRWNVQEEDLEAQPLVYEKGIQLCAKISLIEKLILEYEDVDRKR
jgi:hypothetical protein